jgi:hypothetical protein
MWGGQIDDHYSSFATPNVRHPHQEIQEIGTEMSLKTANDARSAMLPLHPYPNVVIRRFTRRTAVQNYKWTCGPQDTTSLRQETAI